MRRSCALSIFLGLSAAYAFVPPSQRQHQHRQQHVALLHMNSNGNSDSDNDDDSNALNKWSRYVCPSGIISKYPHVVPVNSCINILRAYPQTIQYLDTNESTRCFTGYVIRHWLN